jgi:hypothetical protein
MDEGTKQTQAALTKGSDLVVILLQKCQEVLICLYCHVYTYDLSLAVSRPL